ncbi:PTS sugar transporter subunit IIB [Amedibacterium intestinale]|uniref:PTS sugar transporter subunit IIB n=1 Tax=Amedibacterium intestinale TaxID=2583452 RepID=UPI000E51F7ED|nr:PTS sugar transporter subunit IIB [Amedibacterium intestinale]RHO19454.1 PTS mannose/fructose/sorbose transporter subunit IIB [Eubacterium sp. AM18-26]RHO22840.1 PTS mannose/fructose/sorbose transporter subunit IIB [Eubacterium sp. AM18-10LB-B]RHO27537.1 PTS mannose/fructose/sorbose transporter subunit IIB [Erysipelotrichaceae bacterium AM17-60]
MIETFRIDERLIHGQVIATWLKTLGITHLIVANDDVAKDEKKQKILKIVLPGNVKCLIKGVDDVIRVLKDQRCESMHIMLIVGNPEDAYKIMKNVSIIPEVNLANYGSITKPQVENKLSISRMVYLDKEDVEVMKKIISIGKPVFTQKTPSEPKKSIIL